MVGKNGGRNRRKKRREIKRRILLWRFFCLQAGAAERI